MNKDEKVIIKGSFVKMYNELKAIDMDDTMINILLLAVYTLNENRKRPEEIHDTIVNSCYLVKAFEDGGNLS